MKNSTQKCHLIRKYNKKTQNQRALRRIRLKQEFVSLVITGLSENWREDCYLIGEMRFGLVWSNMVSVWSMYNWLTS